MRSHTIRYVRGVIVALTALTATCGLLRADDASCSWEVRTDKAANAYIAGEPIQMAVYTNAPRADLTYQITDHEDAYWEHGSLRAGAACPALLELRHALPPGLYTLDLSDEAGEATQDVFCVVPNPNEGIGDGRMFGLNCKPTNDEEWDALTRMGTRVLRTEFSWPTIEGVKGQYDFRYFDYVVENAREHGLRLMILTGHTPKAYSMPPVDREGRVADAWFTWAPADTEPWFRFLDAIGGRVLDEKLEPAIEARTKQPVGMGLPLVAAWEVWSEADQNFYYGDWNRYLDMLRVAYCTLKSHDPRVPVVYGSCGHWTEAAYTVQANCEDYFDLAAHHPGGTDPVYSLGHWYVNMPQVFIKPGKPRESAFTECYFHPADPEREAGFQLQMFATLRAWNENYFIRSGCLGGVIGRPDTDLHALLWRDGDKLVPREAYVAWAAARWLMEDAFYVGPLAARAGEQRQLFIKHGSPMVVAWGDRERNARFGLSARAQVVDHMGRTKNLGATSYDLPIGPDAIALRGVGWDYVAEALRASTELTLTTEMGFVPERNSGYIDPLEQDASMAVRASFGDEIRSSVESVCAVLATRPARAPGELFEMQRLVGEGMVAAARNCQASDTFTPMARNTIWRLAQYVEELGMVADGIGQSWLRMNNVSDADMARVINEADKLRTRVRTNRNGAECAFAERLLDRAADQLDSVRLSEGRNRGAWWAALTQVRAAHAVASVEPAILRRVFAVADFPTAQAVTKGTLVPPQADHQVAVRVYNFLGTPVDGSLSVQVPEEWDGPEASVAFSAPARGCTEPLEVAYAVPTNPMPWINKQASRPYAELPVQLPEQLPANAEMWLSGQVAEGAALPDMKYRLCVGRYASSESQTQLVSR